MNFYTLSCAMRKKRRVIRKTLLFMKLVLIILCTAVLQAAAVTSRAQNVTLRVKDAPLERVINDLKDQTGFSFIYEPEAIHAAKPVTIDLKNTPLKEALDKCFYDQPLEYTIATNVVAIKRKSPGLLQILKDHFSAIDVTGRVTDENNQPLPGATVKVKGGSNSTITDIKGNFMLKGVASDSFIQISFVGYEKQEVKAVADMGTVILKIASSQLDAVQVIAYGQTTRRYSTGNITTVGSKEIEKQPVSNPAMALEGLVPGVFITQNNGLPGTGVKIAVQGQNSIGSGNAPFLVVDGVPYLTELPPSLFGVAGASSANSGVSGSPLSFINPADIESISILKDADATSIYGSRAANGAIIITTKKGKSGVTSANFNLQEGIGHISRYWDLLNTQQYLQMRHEALKNSGSNPYPSLKSDPTNTDFDINGLWDTTRYTNWEKLLLGNTSHYTDLNGSVSGGNALTQFLVGTTYHRETSVFPGSYADQRGALHYSITNSSADQKFHLQFSGNYLVDINHLPGAGDLTSSAVFLAPDAPKLRNADGTLNWQPDPNGSFTFLNPLAGDEGVTNIKTTNFITNLQLSYLLARGLVIRSSFGYTDLQTYQVVTSPSTANPPEYADIIPRGAAYNTANVNTWTIEPQLQYDRAFGKSKVQFLLGSTIQQNNTNSLYQTASGFNSDLVLENIQSASSVYVFNNTISTYKYNALFGRINYNLADELILDINARRDGSSRFGPENRFHNFASAGFAWIFSETTFVKDNLSFLSFGKLRASYGTTGNDQIGDYAFLNLYHVVAGAVPYQGATGLAPNGISNPLLQWEETRKFNAGMDLGFFKDRLLLNINYSINRSSNQLLAVTYPVSTGVNFISQNFPATVQNSSLEITLHGELIKQQNFGWTANLNLTLPKNKLVAFPNLSTSTYAGSLVIGQPVNLLKLYREQGVDPKTGLYVILDKNGQPTTTPGPDDATVLLDPNPKYFGGLENNLRFGHFNLSFLFQFTKRKGQDFSQGIYEPGNIYSNAPVTVLKRWQQPGNQTSIQQYDASGAYRGLWRTSALGTDAAYTDASYVRLRNLALSWALPQGLLQTLHLRSGQVNLLGQNLLTFTHYQGFDPETLSVTGLPPLKVFTLGLQIGL